MNNLSRRSLLAGATIVGLSGKELLAFADNKKPFKFMLNTSTIRGQKLPLKDQVEVAAKAGYDAIEPWISDIDQFIKDGGNLKDMGKRIKDSGLTMESAIGFFEWIVDDDEKRKQAIELAKKTMEIHDIMECIEGMSTINLSMLFLGGRVDQNGVVNPSLSRV